MTNEIEMLDPDTKVTWNHKEIKKWVEDHNGVPAIFDDPNALGDKLGIRIDFEGKIDERFMSADVESRETSWEKFFEIFEKRKLAFAYNKKDEPEDVTMAYLLIPRDNA